MIATLPGIHLDAFEWREHESLRLRSGERWSLTNKLVRTREELAQAFEYVSRFDEAAYDTETSGLKPHLGARICGHAIAVCPAPKLLNTFYFPVRHQNTSDAQLDPVEVAGYLRAAVARWKRLRGHHIKFDALMARADGVELTCEWVDTAIKAVVHNENEHRFGLKPLSDKYVLAGADSEEQALEEWLHKDARALKLAYSKRKRSDEDSVGEPTYLERFGYARAPIELCGIYSCHDVALTWLLDEYLTPKILPTYKEVYTREINTAHELFEMEWWGLPVDVNEIHEADRLMRLEIVHWKEAIRAFVGRDIETTDAELRKLFYVELGMEPQKLTKGSLASVDKEARSLLQKRYPAKAPLIKAIDRLAVAEKIHSTYAGSWLRYVTPANRVHSSYNQLEQRDEEGIPKTGRLASDSPNAQNIASKPVHLFDCLCSKCASVSGVGIGKPHTISIRRYYIVPHGFVRVFIDLSQIEIRVLAWLTQDPRLLHCYANDLDVHQMTADACTGGNRDLGKIVGLGIQYGMTSKGMAKRLPGYTDDPDKAEKDAQRFIDSYFETYAGVGTFRDKLFREMRANNDMFVSPFGRPRRIPNISSTDKGEVGRAIRMMMSSIVSGSSADLNKEIMLRTRGVLRAKYDHLQYEQRGKMVQSIHDENIYDLPIEGCGPVIHELHRCFTNWSRFENEGVPIKASIAVSTTTWEGKRPIKLLPGGMFSIV